MRNITIQPFVALVATLMFFTSTNSNATAAFARSTGASCIKCHTLAFPKLTAMGERFMRNGFQMPKEENEDGGFALADDVPEAGKKSDLKTVSEYLAVTGGVRILDFTSKVSTPEVGNPTNFGLLVTGTVIEDTPIWFGLEAEGGSVNVHSYYIGQTNVMGSPLLNFRAGTLDPTTWTSFYGHNAGLDSVSASIGAYGEHHDDSKGFSAVGPGYIQRNGIEYYGYTDSFLWSGGLTNGDVASTESAEHDHAGSNHDRPDVWLVGRMDFAKSASMSILWYHAFGYSTDQSLTIATNFRTRAFDFRAQYTTVIGSHNDSGSGDHSEPMGYTVQADYALTRELLGTLRFDSTSTGDTNGTENQLTTAVVFKPKYNVKITAAYVSEITAATVGHSHNGTMTTLAPFGDHASLYVRFMF